MIDESGQSAGFGVVTQTADRITAIKKAFPNMFRPLEWHHFDGKTEHGHGEWWAHGSRGMFHIYDVREKFPDDSPFYAKELSDQLDTLEMAQEAVQKRHEMDIVMCLDPGFLSTLESLQRENEELKRRLFPYADTTEISGISWDGKYLIGDKASIKDFLEMQNRGLQIDVYKRAYDEKAAALQVRADRAEAELKRLEEWKPISEADTSITNTITMPGLTVRNSDSYWVRDDDGRIYEACWTDHRNGYWWDIEGESPVDPVEFMPHPLARAALFSTGDTHGN